MWKHNLSFFNLGNIWGFNICLANTKTIFQTILTSKNQQKHSNWISKLAFNFMIHGQIDDNTNKDFRDQFSRIYWNIWNFSREIVNSCTVPHLETYNKIQQETNPKIIYSNLWSPRELGEEIIIVVVIAKLSPAWTRKPKPTKSCFPLFLPRCLLIEETLKLKN